MVSITIEPADNGVVKVVYDDSVNGAGEEFVARKVYDFDRDQTSKDSIVDFLTDVMLDLGIESGTKLDKYRVSVIKQWGDISLHNEDDIKKRIETLQKEINSLEGVIKK